MEALKSIGKARSIGVSNHARADIEATLQTAVDPPVINQVEYHPYLQRIATGFILSKLDLSRVLPQPSAA